MWQEKSRLYTRNFVNDYDFGVKRATLAQTPATFAATFARSRTTMPATFATFTATFTATLVERHARRSGHRSPPRPHRRSRVHPPTRHQGNMDGGNLAAKAASPGAEDNTTPQGHKWRPQGDRDGGGIGIAPSIKTPHRGVKMANRAYSRKAAGIHREQKKTPHSVGHAGHGYFWSFARSSSSKTGCNRIYNRTKGGTSLYGNCSTYAGAGQAKVNRRVVVVLV